MKVVFTSRAKRSLEEIADYIARDNPSRAVSFVRELREKALGLADMPRAFPLVPRYERHGVRRRVHGNYLIFYVVGDDAITVVRMCMRRGITAGCCCPASRRSTRVPRPLARPPSAL